MKYQPQITVSSADLVVPMVISIGGIGIVPRPFAQEKLLSGDIFEINTDKMIPTRSVCLVWNKSVIKKPAVEALLEIFELA
jgi:DNA-binding transcriptional LysR family regulator